MNRKRAIGAGLAVLMAVLGTLAIVAYVNGAEERAASGETVAEVFVVTRRVPAGTAAEDLARFVELDTVPQKLINGTTVGELADLEGLVARDELLPGETLSAARFISPTIFDRDADRVIDVPPGMQELTLSLTPDRAGGGLLVPGDTVGVFLSFDPFDISSTVPVEIDGFVIPPNGRTPNTTHGTIHKVLVTNVQLEELPEVQVRQGLGDEESEEVRLVPSGNLLVTLAVETGEAEQIVFGLEFGYVWLSNEPGDATEAPSIIQHRGTIYEDVDPTELDESDDSIAQVSTDPEEEQG